MLTTADKQWSLERMKSFNQHLAKVFRMVVLELNSKLNILFYD